ncbi:MAG: ABC transporter permease, partial [Pseudomonadota bacterium]
MKTTLLAIRFALRDLRGGVRGFGVFIACITLGVMAIAGVGSVAASLADGIADAGRVILGGDLSFSLVQRQASHAELAFLQAHGEVSAVATMRAIARISAASPRPLAGEGATLVEVKAVDAAYPLFGMVVTRPAMPLPALFAREDGAFGAAIDPSLLTRLNLRLGERVAIGKVSIDLRAALINEPDKLAGGIALGPRVLISEAALRASGLIQPGSLVRWLYRLRLPAGEASDRAVTAIEKQAQTAFPHAGWEMRTREKPSPQIERSIARFSQFLALVALTALIVGGVGVANAVASQLNSKRDAIATMKALGASGGAVFAIYCAEIALVALFAAAIGAGLGATLPFAISRWLGAVVPLPLVPSVHSALLALAIAYGLLTALSFALWPLGRAHDISVAALFRGHIAAERRRPRARYAVATVLIVAVFAALAVLTTNEWRIAAIFLLCAASILFILRIVA